MPNISGPGQGGRLSLGRYGTSGVVLSFPKPSIPASANPAAHEKSTELTWGDCAVYAWYRRAVICVVYLADVPSVVHTFDDGVGAFAEHGPPALLPQQLRGSRWCTRGWTLQELIAPKTAVFVDADWKVFGLRNEDSSDDGARAVVAGSPPSLAALVEDITRVPTAVLCKRISHRRCSVAQRMSWASQRRTTRIEDQAYCLLGLFDINMPLMYGEGRKAFRRLQQKITRATTDGSVFVCSQSRNHPYNPHRMLARAPADFAGADSVESTSSIAAPLLSFRGQGFQLEIPAPPQQEVFAHPNNPHLLLPRLRCSRRKGVGEQTWLSPCVAVLVKQMCGHYARRRPAFSPPTMIRFEVDGPLSGDDDAHLDPPVVACNSASAEQPLCDDEDSIRDPSGFIRVPGPATVYIHGEIREMFECKDRRDSEHRNARRRLGLSS